MKIYEIGTGYTPIPAQLGAATEIVVEELTRSFFKRGIDVEIIDIAASNREKNNLPITEVNVPKMFTQKDVSLGVLHKLKRVVYSIALAGKLNKILKKAQERIVIHFHNQYNLFFFLKLVSKKRRENAIIAYTNHSYIWHGDWDEIKDTIKKRYFQESNAMPYADVVFVLNEKAKNNIIEHCNVETNKVHLIKNGVNTEVYKPLSDEKIELCKNEYSLQDKMIFVQVGSVCQRKNQLMSLELLLPFMKQDSSIVFCYAGGIIDEDYQNQIIKFAKENDIEERVCYFGELKPGKSLNDLYNMAQAMIFPSTAEGFSLTVIESLSAGVPVIIQSSLTFELSEKCLAFSNVEEFESIINLINNQENHSELKEKSRSYVEQEYSWEKIAEKHLEILESFEGGNKQCLKN